MPDIKKILCPVDFSELSRHALEHALVLAGRYEARVTVLHVLTPPQPLALAPGMPAGLPAMPLPQPHEVAEEVRRFAGLNDLPSPRAEVVVTEGHPAREIVAQAERLPADLLVMGTHGRGGFERLFLGSVTEKVLRSTGVPVLTVPPPLERVGTVVYKTILCPIEFSDPSTRALDYALMLARESGARLILLHVVEALVDAQALGEPSHFSVPEYRRHLEDDARVRLKAAVPEAARAWCTPDERVVSGRAYRVILDTAEREKAEIIVMGVHGKGALNRLLFGSTTHHVIREARCPVLTLRA